MATEAVTDMSTRRIRIALAGNPNAGKSSIFNALCGARQHVGNYPGVTVERRTGHFIIQDRASVLIDLPGTYSLTSWSPEERVASDELLTQRPDVTVLVVDSNNLQRGLVLLLQVMQLGQNPVLCLNMADEAKRAGQDVDLEMLERTLRIPVVETVGHRGEGMDRLRAAIIRALDAPVRLHDVKLVRELDEALAVVGDPLKGTGLGAGRAWVASRLLVGDEGVATRVLEEGAPGQRAVEAAARQRHLLAAVGLDDIAVSLAEAYYRTAARVLEPALRSPAREDEVTTSDQIDRVLAHRKLGLPFFLVLMYGVFWLTFSVGDYPVGWLETLMGWLGGSVAAVWPSALPGWTSSLVVDGIIGGVGGVLVFLPNIVLLFFGLALLEDTGYMARGAFLMDRFMRRFGLHGKSFIPMVCGFGCTVPGIMGARIMENEKDRLITMLVLPLMSCGARLPIWMLLVPAFFPAPWRAPVLWFIYFFGVILALLLALLLRRTLLRDIETPFVMELPPYRLPTAKSVVKKMTERSWLYLRKAGTVILGISVVMWVITVYPQPPAYEVDRAVAQGELTVVPDGAAAGDGTISESELRNRRANERLQYSIAGQVGRVLEPLVAPLGFDWKLSVAMVGAFAAKEVFVSQMGIVYALGGELEEEGGLELAKHVRAEYSPAVGVALILFLLIATPCMATVAVMRRESGGWRWAAFQFFGLTLVGYLVAFVAYQVTSLLI